MNTESNQQGHYNILTSSDNTLVPQIAISLTAMAKNLAHAQVDFYLMHSRITRENIQMLSALCSGCGNISFHEINVPDQEAYEPLVRAGRWHPETYYPLCAHLMLPETLDRILYLDAGDTLVVGDIGPYYTCDFEDNLLTVTGQKYKIENGRCELFTQDDVMNRDDLLPGILEGVFNSGSYMINLKKMRESGINLSFYCRLTEQLRGRMGNKEESSVYFGDQGLLSAALIGRLKYYGYPQIDDVWYNPYNFCVGYYAYFDEKPHYEPAVIHFAGVPFKPWKANYPIFPQRFGRSGGELRELSELKPMQLEYYFLWLEYLFLMDKVLGMLGY